MSHANLPANIPRHVAIIMDGNGRWAAARGRSRAFGHRKGVEAVRNVARAASNLGVRYLTLFSFSTENWNRPTAEVDALFELLRRFVAADLDKLHEEGVRVRILGCREGLSNEVLSLIETTESRTVDNNRFFLNIAFNYGARNELVRAARRMFQELGEGTVTFTEDQFEQYLDTAGQPDPDLVIRTSGEYRVSNFLLWQSAYAEFYFTNVLWPDFGEAQFRAALEAYACRDRRYGGVHHG